MDPTITRPIKKRASVYLDDSSETEPKEFHCPSCGKIVFEYFSSVQIVMPGMAEFATAPLVVQCNGSKSVWSKEKNQYINILCKIKYYIQ